MPSRLALYATLLPSATLGVAVATSDGVGRSFRANPAQSFRLPSLGVAAPPAEPPSSAASSSAPAALKATDGGSKTPGHSELQELLRGPPPPRLQRRRQSPERSLAAAEVLAQSRSGAEARHSTAGGEGSASGGHGNNPILGRSVVMNVAVPQAENQRPDVEELDTTSFIYWGCIYGSVFAIACFSYFFGGKSDNVKRWVFADVYSSQLPQNLWALNLVASIGQVKVGKKYFNPYVSMLMCITLGLLQIITLFLVVHDIDPAATPVTVRSSSPWIESPWSVNLMKWLMVAFLSVYMTTDGAECRTVFQAIIETNRRRMKVPKLLLFSVCSMQYIIVLLVEFCGVCAVLSFQAVPDILYSSMAVTFLSRIDEAVFELFHQVFNVEANFEILHGFRDEASPRSGIGDLFDQIDVDGDGTITREELAAFTGTRSERESLTPEPLPRWMDITFRVLVLLPLIMGFGLLFRAFSTNVMPTHRVHRLKKFVLHHLTSLLALMQ